MDRDKAERMRARWSGLMTLSRVAPLEDIEKGAEASPGAQAPQVAIGVEGEGKSWRLAVRVQRSSPRLDKMLEAMREEADGEVEVRYIGRVIALNGTPRDRVRPLITGISCGHAQGEPGTIACFVKNRNVLSSPRFLLSNNHVIGLSNLARQTDSVLQPAFLDLPAGDNVVGTFERLVELQADHNIVDAAIARIDVQFIARAVFGQPLPIAGIRTAPLSTGDRVMKIGRTTGETHGTIFAIGVDNLAVDFNGVSRSFDQQIEIAAADADPFCDGGDSGSLILDEDFRAVGLLFGKSNAEDRLCYANPISEVLDRLLVDIE